MIRLKASAVAAALWAVMAAGALESANGRGAAQAQQPSEASAQAATLLSEDSFWRFHVALRRPTVGAMVTRCLRGHAETMAMPSGHDHATLPVKVAYRSYPGLEHMDTDPPPAGWTRCDFDDAAWPRARAASRVPSPGGPRYRQATIDILAFGPGVRFSTSLLCLRGKFAVTDPSAVRGQGVPAAFHRGGVPLYLSMTYRGGVVVYLNGREIARQHLPQGKLGAKTPGAPYPAEAYLDAKGKPIPGPYHAGKRIQAGESDLARRVALRDRRLGPVPVPHELLRKGVNVLAIELHRSDYHPSARLWFREPHFRTQPAWVPVGLIEVRLAAEGSGVVPNVARPKGFQAWNHDLNDRVNVLDYGDPNEPLRPIRLIAPMNAVASGKVVVGSTDSLRRLDASATPLKATDGGAVIPAAKIRIRFGVLDGHAYQRPDWFDALADPAPAEVALHKTGAAVQPVWVTVHVPRGAAPGEYRGQLGIAAARAAQRSAASQSSAGIERITVPIHLHVADWSLPDPKDFRTYVGIYQSPTSLALQYKVAEWSERHWRLMDRSFALLAQVGTKIVNIPLSNRTQFGNDRGMVYWVRKPDGTFDHDLAVFDRYLRLVKKHLEVVDFVVLHVWHSGGWGSRGPKQQNTVTVLDPRTGRLRPMQVPEFGTEQSKGFWRPVLDAIRRRLAAAGMEQAMCLGILSDGTAPPEVFKAFDEIAGGVARWTRGCHSACRAEEPYPLKGGGVVVCHEFCYGMAMADPAKGLPAIWRQRSWPGVAFIRHNFDHGLSLLKYRTMAERSLYCGTRGIGRIGLDFWDVIDDARGRKRNIYNRWPHSSCAQREPNLFHLAAPGPDGPLPTVRFEQFRQGVQEAEATVFLAEAVGEHASKLGPELADECRRVLVERMRYVRRRCPEAYGRVYFRSYHYGWQDLTFRLYNAAAKAARKLRP